MNNIKNQLLLALLLAFTAVFAQAAPPNNCLPGGTTAGAIGTFGEDLVADIGKASRQGPDAVGLSAKELRNSPGVANASRLPLVSDRFFRGNMGNAGYIPRDIAEQMIGTEYRSFRHFREDFWGKVGSSHWAADFIQSNRTIMSNNRAPWAVNSQHIGARGRYELHHITPIHQGGSVYDLGNLMVVTPRFHKEVLDRKYHYGN
jgi:hypothetical protein